MDRNAKSLMTVLIAITSLVAVSCATKPRDAPNYSSAKPEIPRKTQVEVMFAAPSRDRDIDVPRLRITQQPGFIRDEDGQRVTLSWISDFVESRRDVKRGGPVVLYFFVEDPDHTTFSQFQKGVLAIKDEILRASVGVNVRLEVSL